MIVHHSKLQVPFLKQPNIYDFERLAPGTEFSGPGIIETPVTTIVVNPNDRAMIDEFLNVRILAGA